MIKAETIDDSDEYLVINIINAQVIQKNNPSLIDKANIIPT